MKPNHSITVCQVCHCEFAARNADLKRNRAKYCSRKCTGAQNRKRLLALASVQNIPNVNCTWCKKEFYKNESKIKSSRNGVFFCSRSCKDIGQRLENGITAIHPHHYNKAKSSASYRTIAFRNKEAKCERCDYSKYKEVLVVHHKDRNRENPSLDNLEILCPTCHLEEHFLAKDGLYNTLAQD